VATTDKLSVQYNNAPFSTTDLFPVNTDSVTSPPALDTVRTVQEIIDNYASTALELSQPFIGGLQFQIEGNFTGSGNREIIGFYGRPPSPFGDGIGGALNAAFCFVLDANGEKIENVYHINYLTRVFTERVEAETGLCEALGKVIVWEGRIIGRFSDFNQNGIEELYLYMLGGAYSRPFFFEFDGTRFIEILEFGTVHTFITGVDPDERRIDIRMEYGTDSPMDVRNNSYVWDEVTRRYELLTTELKRYRWNNIAREWEEIVD
jgi:hypothetical protein